MMALRMISIVENPHQIFDTISARKAPGVSTTVSVAPDSAGGGIFTTLLFQWRKPNTFKHIPFSLLYVDILIYAGIKYYQLM